MNVLQTYFGFHAGIYSPLFHSCQGKLSIYFAPFGQCMYVRFFSVVIFYDSEQASYLYRALGIGTDK